MKARTSILLLVMTLCATGLSQSSQKRAQDQPVRISTELVQWDVVVTDKDGKVVPGLTREDFELYESGKKQVLSFFEYVDAANRRIGAGKESEPLAVPSTQGLTERDIHRIFAFVIDDLTIRSEDMVYVRDMLTNFVNKQMQPRDLVAIVRAVGGRGLLQQFTTDKELLLRAIAALTPSTHPLNIFNRADQSVQVQVQPLSDAGAGDIAMETSLRESLDLAGTTNTADDSQKLMRATMSLGTASFVIESMKQLPGRKSLVLVSGGLPLFDPLAGAAVGNITSFMNTLADQATRAAVAIHTLDIAGMSAQVGVARFTDTPAKSMLPMDLNGMSSGAGNADPALGRRADTAMLGRDTLAPHLGLRALSSATGGIAVLNKNNFNEGLDKIIGANQGYYLLAYTPETKFDGKFRKIEVRVRRSGLRVYSRQGYLARQEVAPAAPASTRDQLLAAIHSPLARREIDFDTTLLYKAVPPNQGGLDIHLLINTQKLQLEPAGDKREANVDVAGFIFDETGRLRGGFDDTIKAVLSEQELGRISKGGLTFSKNTTLPAGVYQLRIAVRDNKSGRIGTTSRYVEVRDLSKGKLDASSLLLGAAPPGETGATNLAGLSADRQISRKQDLRYAVIVYNAKVKEGKPQVKAQMSIIQNGKVIYKAPEEDVAAAGNASQVMKWGQLGLSRVAPGRYTMSLVITDLLADKKYQTMTRGMDFIVVE